MKTTSIILPTLILMLSFGQLFGQKYSQIELTYAHGFYPFNKMGKFDTREKVIIKPISATEYKIEEISRIKKYQFLFNTIWTKKRISKCKTKFDSMFIDGFVKSLSSDSFPLNSKSFDSKKYLENISLNKIRNMARYDDNAWFFRKSNSDTSDLNFYVRDIKNPARLDSFLLDYQSKEIYDLMVVDAYHYLQIKIFVQNDSILYESNLWRDSFWGQPIIDRYSTKNDSSFSPAKHAYNLRINNYLLTILPKNFDARKRFEIDKFLNYYIAWYSDKVYKEYFEKKIKPAANTGGSCTTPKK